MFHSTRVLVVEDFAPFRQFIRSTLVERADLKVICEVADGLEAVQKAEELQPHLILLDIGLPTLNGINAARRIRKVSPTSKIIFVTQESSPDIAEEALASGGLGYVVKANAGSELMAAVEAVRQGMLFVSVGVAGQRPAEVTDEQVPKGLHPNGVLAPIPGAGD
jgi:DNA-binding NarL/FixJ family response regulator